MPPTDDSLDTLLDRLTPTRRARMLEAAAQRMKGVTVVLEALYDPGNRGAIQRSAEANGLLDVHIVRPEVARKSAARAVSRGAEKWLRTAHWPDATTCCDHLRARGFRIYAADLTAARPLSAIDFSHPTALVFGNEHEGISDAMRDACDGAFVLPMRGFVQSYNVSVAAAIAIQHARGARERAIGATTDLTPSERDQLFERWVRLADRWSRTPKTKRRPLQGGLPVASTKHLAKSRGGGSPKAG